jgi:hypothetical protein
VTRQVIVQVLEGAGLVTHEKRGREVLYALDAQRLDEAREFLDGISAGWDRAIERLRRIVEEPPARSVSTACRPCAKSAGSRPALGGTRDRYQDTRRSPRDRDC